MFWLGGFFYLNFSKAEEESRALQQSEGLGEQKTTLSQQGWGRDRDGAVTGMEPWLGWSHVKDGAVMEMGW